MTDSTGLSVVSGKAWEFQISSSVSWPLLPGDVLIEFEGGHALGLRADAQLTPPGAESLICEPEGVEKIARFSASLGPPCEMRR